jgi:hypothetical protein
VQYNVDYNQSLSTIVILVPPKTNFINHVGISSGSIIYENSFSKGDSGTKHFNFSGHFWGVTTKNKNDLYSCFSIVEKSE